MKRVFVLSGGSIFGEGVQRLVARESGLDIVGAETDLGRAIARIREPRPDVIIVDQDIWTTDSALDLMRLRECEAEIKVIGLSLQGNSFSRYSREMRTIQRVEDLMEAIG